MIYSPVFIFFTLITLIIEISEIHGLTSVARATAGQQATLICRSNNNDTRFMFWKVVDNNNNIVGPDSYFDTEKYNYEVLTGKLYIWSVSTRESGFYHCVSRNISNHSKYSVHTIELIVNKNDYYWESEFEVTLLRSLMIVMIIVVSIAVYLLVTTRRKEMPKEVPKITLTSGTGDSKGYKQFNEDLP